jgi:hypothetical protein
MKKLLVVLLVVSGIYACTEAIKQSVPAFKVYNAYCYNNDTNLCSILPYEVAEKLPPLGYDSRIDSIKQPPFDVFSWQTFVALNWPADDSGNPVGNSINGNPTNMRVWEYYIDPNVTFGAYNSAMISDLQNAKANGIKLLTQDSKSPFDFDTTGQGAFTEADGKPLADRNRNFTLYEIKINNVEDTFITKNKLTSATGIYNYITKMKLGNGLQMPVSDTVSNPKNPGFVEIKASWRILDPSKGDDTSRYYCRKALIMVDAAHTLNKKPLKVWATVGLVGMHIIRNIERFSSFEVWSTFEHVDNAPDSTELNENRHWSYYNKANTAPANVPPALQPGDNAYLWDSVAPYASHYYPGSYGTQVTRMFSIYNWTDSLNKMWRAKLKGSVWANYKLVGTQWMLSESNPALPAPVLLANTTMETYMQPGPMGSCIKCHNGAAVQYIKGTDTINITTDMSFLYPFLAKQK